ncbi:MAG: tellurite resistance TerB family protein [Burkholderiaceae bacterium]
MLKSIRDFFERNLAPVGDAQPSRHTIELATAALLIEVVRCDAGITDEERQSVHNAVRDKFGLAPAESETLIRLAEDEVAQANDLFQFTSLINRDFTQQQKQRVIELMWRAALADAQISAHENHVLRRVAELLHVTHGDYIAAKTRAQSAP